MPLGRLPKRHKSVGAFKLKQIKENTLYLNYKNV